MCFRQFLIEIVDVEQYFAEIQFCKFMQNIPLVSGGFAANFSYLLFLGILFRRC